jgi:hypothetical protein
MRDQFGIGFRLELVAAIQQRAAQLNVVFDDPIMDDGDRTSLMRVSVFLGRTPMRGPSRMADAGMALDWRIEQTAAQIPQLAYGTADFQLIRRRKDRDSGRIITAVFEPFEPTEQDWAGVARPHVTNYSTH